MLDHFAVSELTPAPGGVSATVGAWTFMFSSSERDSSYLTESEVAQVWCEIEFDVTAGTIQALAFASVERRALYRALRAIGGIGRVSAFAVLDAGEVIDTLRAVAGQDADYFKAVPGLGPKKVADVIRVLGKRYGGSLPQPLPAPVSLLVEARDALVHEGRSLADAEQALLLALGGREVRSSEEWLALLSEAP